MKYKYVAVLFRTIIENWRLLLKLARLKVALSLIRFWEETKHFFGSTIPLLLQWFGRNWKDVFVNIRRGTKAIFVNMYKNIANFFKGVKKWQHTRSKWL